MDHITSTTHLKKQQFSLFKMVVDMELEENKKKVFHLMKEKDDIEAALKEQKSILDKNHVGMLESLVDDEGYPRADIDVYQVRHARHKIICLQNDYKAVMKKIDQGLVQVFAVGESSSTQASAPAHHPTSVMVEESLREPFLRVNLVSEKSPAEQAGIRVNDLITEFGSVHVDNFKSLKDIGDLVEHSRYKPLIVKLKRAEAGCIVLTLTPKPWAGKGLLGCNVIPLEMVER